MVGERADGQSEQFPTDGLTPEEDRQLAGLLTKWQGGKISTPVFTELAKMIPQPIVEVVLFRMNGGILETLLIPRPQDDIVWPGMYHTPGAALRRADFLREDQEPMNGGFERIQKGELKSEFAYAPVFAGLQHRLASRGPEVAAVYFTELPEESSAEHHVWYPVDQLAQNPRFIQHQLGHVLLAAEHYRERINR